MDKKTLVKLLEDYPDDMEVMILDGFNGGGCPRTINLGPFTRMINDDNEAESSDCELKVGNTIIVMGYGCY